MVEADESDGSFVYLDPFVSVITNIEADHLDHYGSLEEIEQHVRRVHGAYGRRGRTWSCAATTSAWCSWPRDSGRPRRDVRVRRGVRRALLLRVRGRAWARDFVSRCQTVRHWSALPEVPGVHMVSNATAALAVAHVLGLDMAAAAARWAPSPACGGASTWWVRSVASRWSMTTRITRPR